jgi:phosphatidylglycerol:prolipoprotein diacylglycerol transferase
LLIPWFKLEPWSIPIPLLGKLDLQPFGLLVALGIVFGSRVAEWHGERNGVPRQLQADFNVYTTVIGLLSAMVLNVIFYEPEKIAQMGAWFAYKLGSGAEERFPYPGLSSYGGFIGGIGAALWFRQKKRAALMVLGDVWCFAIPFGWFFGRMGCFTVHDHPGKVSDFFLAVDNYNLQGEPRHDLGFYEVLWSAAVMGLFLWLGKKRRKPGFYMALLPLLYAPIRFLLDYLRETPEGGGDVRYAGLTPAQYASLGFIVAGIMVLRLVLKKPAASLWLDGAPPAPEHASSAAKEKAGSKRPAHAKSRK